MTQNKNQNIIYVGRNNLYGYVSFFQQVDANG